MQSEKKIITLCGTFNDDENSLMDFEVKIHASEAAARRYCFEKARVFLEEAIRDGGDSLVESELHRLEKEENKKMKAEDCIEEDINYIGNDCEFQAVVRKIDAS